MPRRSRLCRSAWTDIFPARCRTLAGLFVVSVKQAVRFEQGPKASHRSGDQVEGVADVDNYSPRILLSLYWTLALLGALAVGVAWVL
jgi:hypothetical protein